MYCTADSNYEQVLNRADAALYKAKELGRNRVVVSAENDEHSERSL